MDAITKVMKSFGGFAICVIDSKIYADFDCRFDDV